MQDTAISPEQIKAFMQQYTDDARNLAVMQERLSALEVKSGSPRTSNLSGLSRGGGSPVDTIGRQVSALEVLRDAVADAEAQLARKRQRVEAVIDILHQQRVPRWPEKCNLLSLRYIDGLGWNDVIETIFGTEPEYWQVPERYNGRIMAYHKKALLELAELCPPEMIDDYEITESGR